MGRRRVWLAFSFVVGVSAAVSTQTPQPFPRPNDPSRPQPTSPQPVPKVLPPQPAVAQPKSEAEPTEQTLGMPLYPGSQFLASYDAGRGQRYFLYGTNASFAEIVAYYRTVLKQRGDLIFEMPPIHMFDVGRFREETMAFPPGVTVKDYTWGGTEGYLNPRRGAQPTHFRTVIQIVPSPAQAGVGR